MDKTRADKIFIYVAVKPYVYKYYMKKFHNNLWNGVKLEKKDEIMAFIRSRLAKPHDWYNRGYQTAKANKTVLAIELTAVDFKYNGFALSETDERELSTMLENRVQCDMLLWVSLHYMVGGKLQKLCEEWKRMYAIEEEDWAVDSIRRMCTRADVMRMKNEFQDFISENFYKYCCNILSHNGTK